MLKIDTDKLPEHYSGKYKGSFAYLTIKDRLPVILVKVVDTLWKNRNSISLSHGEKANEELKEIIGAFSQLQNEIVTDKLIKPLLQETSCSLIWNKYLTEQEDIDGFVPSWFQSSWLYVECYFYKRINQAFEISSCLKHYDPFLLQKQESFCSTLDAVKMLCITLMKAISEVQNSECNSMIYDYFRNFLEVSLWGNKWDLSISAGKENVQPSNPLNQLEEIRKNILVYDVESVFEIIKNANRSSKQVQIDFILDNAGFELFCDLCFMHYLQATNLVSKIRIHVKRIPWFVSDTLEKDFEWLLNALLESGNDNLVKFSQDCTKNITSGYWTIEKQDFWTFPHDFSDMLKIDSQLYHRLSESDLLIFKGDLNYRKLTGDRQWQETTLFKDSLNGFIPTSLVSLRTIKADVVVGLQEGTSDKLCNTSENWKFSGDFALVQCCKKSTN